MGLSTTHSEAMDIHSPAAVRYGASSSSAGQNAASSNGDVSASELMALIKEKDGIEDELRALGSVLDSHGVNMQTSLTTFDGYPRDDIDVAQIRTTRVRIIHLRNDLKALMSRIEKGLHAHHASFQRSAAAAAAAGSGGPSTQSSGHGAPFAVINSVAEGGPADQAGLKAGDFIRKFGLVNATNHNRLARLAEEVRQNENRPIQVVLLRKSPLGTEAQIEVELTPKSGWGGRGLLGCHLLPI